jgi:hypothetical protein
MRFFVYVIIISYCENIITGIQLGGMGEELPTLQTKKSLLRNITQGLGIGWLF